MNKKNGIKQIVEYSAPPILLDVVRAFRPLLTYPRLKDSLKLNLKWQNAYAGEKVFVLGNGPSLADVDQSIFRGQRVIVMNSFDRAEWKSDVEIVAHCLGEPRNSPSWSDFSHIINGTNAASYWLNYSSKGHLNNVEQDKKLHYVNPTLEPGICGNTRTSLHSMATLTYQTTAQLAIQVALYMGFTEIILLGFDHTWLASPQYSKHFYSNEKDADDTIGQCSYLALINLIKRMWVIYYKLNDISQLHGASIYNMTENSYLDVFDRVKTPQI